MKNFLIFKNNHKQNEKQPDYKIMASNEGEDLKEMGGCWLKDGKNGKYFSCRLNATYADHTSGVKRTGYSLVADKQTETVENYSESVKPEGDSPF